jgi:threonine dehydrogenase-like Zn-dependent dehydrogenase
MKAAVTEGRGDIRIVEMPVPKPGLYQCLCKISACATCTGTDIKIIHEQLPWKEEYPGIVGHESIGTVIETGDRVRYIKKGEIRLRPCAIYPGMKFGDYYSLWGGFAEYGLITDARAMKEDNPDTQTGYEQYQLEVPADLNISPAEAIMLITLKETAGFVAEMKVGLNRSVVVLGAGSVASAMCLFSKLLGAWPLIVIARRDEPLENMRRFGANFTINNAKEDMKKRVVELTGGKGTDFIIDTAGDVKFFTDAVGMLAENGKIAPYATFTSADAIKGVDETKILKANTGEVAAHNYLLDLVRLKKANLKDFYSHTMPFVDITKGFEMIKKKEASKIVFEM